MNKQNTLELLDKLDKVLDSMNTKEIIDQVILSKALNFLLMIQIRFYQLYLLP